MNLLALLLSLFPLSGGQVHDFALKWEVQKPDSTLASFYYNRPFSSGTTFTNYCIIATLADWNTSAMLKHEKLTQTQADSILAEYVSLPPTDNQAKFVSEYTGKWGTNSPVVQRLLLKQKEPSSSSWRTSYNGTDVKPSLVWLTPQSCLYYIYVNGKWQPSVAPHNNTSRLEIQLDWKHPEGTNYMRSFKSLPAWQVTYIYQNHTLERTCVYCTNKSYIKGVINGESFVETLICE